MTTPNPTGTQKERILYKLMNQEKVWCWEFVERKPKILNHTARLRELRKEGRQIENTKWREKRIRHSFYTLGKSNEVHTS